MARNTTTVGSRGQTVIPAKLRKQYGLDEGSLLIVEDRPEGILLRPAIAVPTETYDPTRKAEFILNNAVDAADYRKAVAAVKAMGVDPQTIKHTKPKGA